MYKRMGMCVLAVLLAITLLGCNREPTVVEPDYSALIEESLDITLEELLDEATVQDELDGSLSCLGVFEDGTQLLFSDESGMHQVMVQMLNCTRQDFDEDMNQLASLSAVEESLGMVSWWDEDTDQLMTYVDGYAISVYIAAGDWDLDVQGTAVNLMKHILYNLEQKN